MKDVYRSGQSQEIRSNTSTASKLIDLLINVIKSEKVANDQAIDQQTQEEIDAKFGHLSEQPKL